MDTSWPRAASSLGRLPITSATPPSLARGTASVATIKILKRISFVMLPSKYLNLLFVIISYEKNGCARQPAEGRGQKRSSPKTGATLLVEYNAPCPL